ncbi:Glycoside hydrolase family 17 protein [Mycena chlorophos]|uniref:glucan endo-1,3-beta-D-glucosidase n=1 Tax=Mycena chlorophos TaxID=658473 RepID=A0A8H6S128_MYCCL|nr:Glycoside hydrolase family 17 protein [Mycena chlorophos]
MSDYRYHSVEPASYGGDYASYGYGNNTNGGFNGYFEAQQKKNNRSKRVVIACIVAMIVLVAVGVGIGVGVSKNSHHTSAKSAESTSGNSSVVSQTDPNDPSTFIKNPALKQSFYGIAYTPYGSQLPNCNNTLEEVITDIQLLSQLTTRIRLYGADCNQSALVLEAIKQTKVDMSVHLAVYPIATDAGAAYVRQRDLVQSALQTYGTDHVLGLTIGNEFILDYLSDNGGASQDPNSDVGNAGADLLLMNITDARSMLQGIGAKIPVGTSDAGSYFNTKVLQAVDFGLSNVHPYFAAQAIDAAASWTLDFFNTTNVQAADALSNKPTMYIAETGWPTKSSSAAAASDGPSIASVENLQIFLNTFVCAANQQSVGYFFFEYFDEGWKVKDVQFGGVEGWWGLFNADRTLKNITIPDCSKSS